MFSGIEAPIEVKERLVREGVYMPNVTKAQVRGNKVRKQTNLVNEGRCIRYIFDDTGESRKMRAEILFSQIC